MFICVCVCVCVRVCVYIYVYIQIYMHVLVTYILMYATIFCDICSDVCHSLYKVFCDICVDAFHSCGIHQNICHKYTTRCMSCFFIQAKKDSFWWLIHQKIHEWFMNELCLFTHMNTGRDWIIHSATSCIHVCVSEKHDSSIFFHSTAQNSWNESAQINHSFSHVLHSCVCERERE